MNRNVCKKKKEKANLMKRKTEGKWREKFDKIECVFIADGCCGHKIQSRVVLPYFFCCRMDIITSS